MYIGPLLYQNNSDLKQSLLKIATRENIPKKDSTIIPEPNSIVFPSETVGLIDRDTHVSLKNSPIFITFSSTMEEHYSSFKENYDGTILNTYFKPTPEIKFQRGLILHTKGISLRNVDFRDTCMLPFENPNVRKEYKVGKLVSTKAESFWCLPTPAQIYINHPYNRIREEFLKQKIVSNDIYKITKNDLVLSFKKTN